MMLTVYVCMYNHYTYFLCIVAGGMMSAFEMDMGGGGPGGGPGKITAQGFKPVCL